MAPTAISKGSSMVKPQIAPASPENELSSEMVIGNICAADAKISKKNPVEQRPREQMATERSTAIGIPVKKVVIARASARAMVVVGQDRVSFQDHRLLSDPPRPALKRR